MPQLRRTFTADFKRQMAQLYENGKSRGAIAREYELSPSALDHWISKRKRQARFLKKITELLKRMKSSLFVSEFSGLKWRMTF